MPETKTNKMMERERTNEETEKQTNETQISKSLNLKSKSKPISFQPINKENEWRGTPERTNLPVESENDGRRGTPERERRSKRRDGVGERVNSITLNSDSPF